MKPISFSELLDKITEGEISKEQMVAIRPLIDDYMRMNTSVTSEIKFVLETNQLYLDQYSENPYMDDWMASTASCSGYETVYNYDKWANQRIDPEWGEKEFYRFDD